MRRAIIEGDVKLGDGIVLGEGVIIRSGAVIGDNVEIGPYTIIYGSARIGDNVKIGPQCIVGHPSKKELIGVDHSYTDPKLRSFVIEDAATVIGEDSVIRSGSVIYTHVVIGRGFNTGHNAIIREHTRIGERCLVGSNSVLNGYSKVGDRSRINTLVALPQSMIIGKGVFIAPMATFSDNKYSIPGYGNEGAVIEDFVRIGIGARILPGLRIGRGSIVGAAAVVTKDVPDKAIVVGNPARVYKYVSDEDLQKYIEAVMGWR